MRPSKHAWLRKTINFLKVRKQAKWLCGHITNHVSNPTEHGYGGGQFCDHWCIYCDGQFQIPLVECPSSQWMVDLKNGDAS